MDLASSPQGHAGHEVGDNNSEGQIVLSALEASLLPFTLPASTEPLNLGDCNVGYVYSSEMMVHVCLKGHPEQPERISRIFQAIKDAQYLARMKKIQVRMVTRQEALLVHSEDHWDKVLGIQFMTMEDIQMSEDYYDHLSLYVMDGTTRAARLSCGGVIEACLAVARNQITKSFAIVRPPGHHAEPDEHMGFCFFNNVAVAAKVVQLLTPVRKIMILDWDVHHGNGTQRAFNDDPSVLYVSIHRYEGGLFYPCGTFGSMESCGEGLGLGYSVNIPWPEKGMGDADYLHAFQKIVMPIAIEFAPELVIISAGFDAARGDDLGECFVSPECYGQMTHMLAGLAGGRLVVALEGGYNLDSISSSAVAVTKVLLGEPPHELPPLTASEIGTETVWLVAKEQSKYWKNVDPKSCEPQDGITEITYSIPEILKAHRQHNLYSEHHMFQIPLLLDEDESRFGAQVMCTPDIFHNQTLVVLVHEFGNLRVELQDAAMCNLHIERSYLIDFSKELISWVRGEGYSLLDVNLFPKPMTNFSTPKHSEQGKEVLTYLWDNYIALSGAENIVLIGHGPGCLPLIDLLSSRKHSVMRNVKMVVQIVGHSRIPLLPRGASELMLWYFNHSLVVIPTSLALHPDFKILRRHGQVVRVDEPRPVKLVITALPTIRMRVKEELERKPSLV